MNDRERVPQGRALTTAKPLELNEYGDLTLSELGRVLAASGYFDGVRDAAQAITKVLWGRERGVPAIQAMMGVNIIKNKLVPSADLLAAMIKSSAKYDYLVTTLDDHGCSITFLEHGKVIGVSTFTREDAQKAGALGGPNKSNWSSYFRNMCFARAMTNGARWYTPDCFGGAVYSAEELGAMVDGDGNVIDVPPAPQPKQDTGFRKRLGDVATGQLNNERDFRAKMESFNPIIDDAIAAGVIQEVPFPDVGAAPLDLESPTDDDSTTIEYRDLPDPPHSSQRTS